MKKFYVIIRYSLVYFIIVFSIALSSVLLLNQVNNSFKNEILQNNLNILEHTRDIVKYELSQLDDFSFKISLDKELQKPLLQSDYSYIIPNIYNIWDSLKNYQIKNNSLLFDYFIYFKNSNIILKSNSIFKDPVDFYEANIFSDYTKDEFEKILKQKHFRNLQKSTKYRIDNTDWTVIPYLHTIPVNIEFESLGTIVFLLDNHAVNQFLSPLRLGETGFGAIIDKNNEIIACTEENIDSSFLKDIDLKQNGNINISENKLLLTSYDSISKLSFVAYIDQHDIYEKIEFYQKRVILFSTIAFIIGLIIIITANYFITKPLFLMNKILKTETNNYANITKNIANIVDSHSSMKTAYEKQKNIINELLLEKIFSGTYTKLPKNCKIEEDAKAYFVALLTFESSTCSTNDIILLEEQIQSAISAIQNNQSKWASIHAIKINSDDIGILFSLKNIPSDPVSFFNIFYKNISAHISFMNKFIISSMKDSFNKISIAFEEVQELQIQSKFNIQKSQIIYYQHVHSKHQSYQFTLHKQLALFNAVSNGNIDITKSILDSLEYQNFIKLCLNKEMISQFISELKGIAIKIYLQLNDDHKEKLSLIYEKIQSREILNEAELFQSLQSFINNAAKLIKDKKHNEYSQLINDVVDYINKHYSEYQLSLNDLSSNFNLSESYLSQLFKKHLKVNVSHYIEKIRIEKAIEKLNKNSLNIDQISTQVGYSYPQVFRRAFKRQTGITPSAYRKKQFSE